MTTEDWPSQRAKLGSIPPASEMIPVPGELSRQGAGHRLVPHTADCIIESWGPDRPTCFTEALYALVEEFAEVGDAPATEVLPLAASSAGSEEALVSLLEEVIYNLDVASVVPLRFHLAETDTGEVAGDMEVVPLDRVTIVGPAPKGVSYHELFVRLESGLWRSHVVIDV